MVRPNAPADDSLLILMPVYNDWAALEILLGQLDGVLHAEGLRASVLVVDDGSTATADGSFPGKSFLALDAIQVLELRRNVGHQRAIAIGLAYVQQRMRCRTVVLMDSDGEDSPADIPRLLAKYEKEGGRKIIFAERARRSESLTFRAFYQLYMALHSLLTGSGVRVGNFSVIPRCWLGSLAVTSETWNHYAAAVFLSRRPYATVPTCRTRRLEGRSKMNFIGLVTHGLSAISVYGEQVGVRLLVATLALIGLVLAGLGTLGGARLFTDLAIPSWATFTSNVLLVVLAQAIMFAFLFSFIVLGGRQRANFLPLRDYVYFVGAVRTLHLGERQVRPCRLHAQPVRRHDPRETVPRAEDRSPPR